MLKTTAFLTLSTLTAAAFCAPTADHADPRDLVGKAKLSLLQAMAAATAACPGAAVQAELEGETDDGKLVVFFEVMIVGADGHLHEVRIDPASGGVLSNEDVTAEADEDGENDGEAHELAAFRATLRHAELTLPALVQKAAEIVNGTPVAAELELEHGGPVCDLRIVHGRYLIQAEVEARAGHLTELELVRDGGHGEPDEHGEGGGEHESGGHDRPGEHGEREGEHGERHEREAK